MFSPWRPAGFRLNAPARKGDLMLGQLTDGAIEGIRRQAVAVQVETPGLPFRLAILSQCDGTTGLLQCLYILVQR
ncbi:hypothetical protein [Marinobacter sp. SS8-8]|uniref:hypothetical protein n=1 Tax=Marinobacter sp. SS8-8 TaxID=3050452 RepID=UPI0026DF9002|nr:hypothetical protein [Marinobacter sp. SS8-8]